jgi:hypothetical protein
MERIEAIITTGFNIIYDRFNTLEGPANTNNIGNIIKSIINLANSMPPSLEIAVPKRIKLMLFEKFKNTTRNSVIIKN